MNATDLISLPTGDLSIQVMRTDIPLDQLCGFAARRNPKRGFLFVSKVLGKHIPVKPSLMRQVHTLLAAKIPAQLPGPVVVIGMAETAIALGHGVYDEYVRLTGRQDTLFLHSTRYRLDRPLALEFREEHSHAADHLMYLPEDQAHRRLFDSARTLVLIDDEASTGATFVNLAQAFKQRIPTIEHIVTGVITDWRGPARSARMLAQMPVSAAMISILEGEYQFQPAPNLVAMEMPKSVGNGHFKDGLLPRNQGRFGLSGRVPLSAAAYDLARAAIHRSQPAYDKPPQGGAVPGWMGSADTDRASNETSAAQVLVLGTGEFAYPPFLLAEELEAAGYDVRYQSTTRSPALIGGAMACGLTFADNYADGIGNYVYNVAPGQYERVIIAHETPDGSLDGDLLEALKAHALEM